MAEGDAGQSVTTGGSGAAPSVPTPRGGFKYGFAVCSVVAAILLGFVAPNVVATVLLPTISTTSKPFAYAFHYLDADQVAPTEPGARLDAENEIARADREKIAAAQEKVEKAIKSKE